MSRLRLLTGLVLCAAGAAVGWWLLDAGTPPAQEGDDGPHEVVVEAPHGWHRNGTVQVPGATALSVLQELALQAGFDVEVEHQAGFGSRACSGVYVVGIGPFREDAGGGWDYHVRKPGGDWEWQPHSAACHALGPGDAVRWLWVEG